MSYTAAHQASTSRTFELAGVPGRRFERWPRGGGHAAMHGGHRDVLQPIMLPWDAPPVALCRPRLEV